MKKLFYFLLPFLIVIGIVSVGFYWLFSLNDSGYIILGMQHWYIERSLVDFLFGLTLTFFIGYVLFRVLGWLYRMPTQLRAKSINVRFNRSQEALIAGLVEIADGNFEKAEQLLVRHAQHSGAPLLHYLTAAKAAQSRGDFTRRDLYLKKAAEKSPDANIAVGLTQAELHLSGQEFDQALNTLTTLHSIDSNHAKVLKLLHQTYQHIGDWEGIQKIIPSLHKNKVLLEVEIKLLEAQTFSELLKKAAKDGVAKVEALWAEMPAHVKTLYSVSTVYYQAMLEVGAGAKVENDVAKTLSQNWNDELLLLFGDIESNDSEKQLKMAELWLPFQQENPLLLTVLGKLCLKCQHLEKAKVYLTQSLSLQATALAYQYLGDVMMALHDTDSAADHYKLGLELAIKETR